MIQKTLDSQERIGRLIVVVIAILNLLSPILQLITDFNLGTMLSLIIAVILSATLFSGVSWVRYLFVLGSCLNIFYYLYLLLVGAEFTVASFGIVLLFIVQIIYSIAVCLLLLFGKPVKEFLYRQKNG